MCDSKSRGFIELNNMALSSFSADSRHIFISANVGNECDSTGSRDLDAAHRILGLLASNEDPRVDGHEFLYRTCRGRRHAADSDSGFYLLRDVIFITRGIAFDTTRMRVAGTVLAAAFRGERHAE